MKLLGIDIGTTSVSVVYLDGENNTVFGKKTKQHNAFLTGEIPAEKIQSPQTLWNITKEVVDALIEGFGEPDVIGLTGQMHGILYIDERGEAVSPLYTWQNQLGSCILAEGKTTLEWMRKEVNSLADGYGLVTHYYLQQKKKIPTEAKKFTTISEYIGNRLCQRREAFIGESMAASLGGFDLKERRICFEDLERLGVDVSFLPNLKKEGYILGYYVGSQGREIPVVGSIGDNQASFFGAVSKWKDTVLINVGTGSQVSFLVEDYVSMEGDVEVHPFLDGRYLLVGSPLCGGRAYAMLEKFYREISKERDCYAEMERQGRAFLERHGIEHAWKITTCFSGTRQDPKKKGEIQGLDTDNFHPGGMVVGMLLGMVQELYESYQKMVERTGKKGLRLIGSGNGIRRNTLLKELAEKVFELPLEVSHWEEEAACGAALFAGEVMKKHLKNL